MQDLNVGSSIEEYELYPITEIKELYLIKIKYECLLREIEYLRQENSNLKKILEENLIRI